MNHLRNYAPQWKEEPKSEVQKAASACYEKFQPDGVFGLRSTFAKVADEPSSWNSLSSFFSKINEND